MEISETCTGNVFIRGQTTRREVVKHMTALLTNLRSTNCLRWPLRTDMLLNLKQYVND